MKLNRLIPFRLKPGSIGLKGKAYDVAEAYHDYTGEELERRLAEIEAGEDKTKLKELFLDIEVKHKHKSRFDADCELAGFHSRDTDLSDADRIKLAQLKITHHVGDPYPNEVEIATLSHKSEEDRALALLRVEFDFEKITELEFEKQTATIKNEPWIAVVNHEFNPIDGINGLSIEFDWNEQWIRFLRANGYGGIEDGEVVDRWFQDVNRSYADEGGYDFVSNGPTSARRVDNGDGSASYL